MSAGAVAGAGGTILVRRHADRASGAVRRLVFYGAAQWKKHRSAYKKAVQITTALTAGPDGSVYFGFTVTGATLRTCGWLLHYNATLTQTKTPGSFGWDNTPSVLPARAVPGYHGTSPYLLVSKYNNYPIGPHGDGHDKVAVLDPRASQKDPYADARVMKAVQTILSPVHEPGEPPGARYEWCINSAVVDVADDSVIVNSEDGTLYAIGR